MDQILLLFDVDQLLPLEGSVDEEDQECRLNYVKEACLRIFFRNCDAANKEKNKLPHFGYRFISTTDYHPSDQQLPTHFKPLTYDSFAELETALDDKFRPVIQNAIRQKLRKNLDYFTRYLKSVDHKCAGEKIRSSLEEALVLLDWDRPSIASPVKSAKSEKDGLGGNQIILFTRIPQTSSQFQYFLHNAGKPHSYRDFTQGLFSKKVQSGLAGYLRISFHILDTSALYGDAESDCDLVSRAELEKCIKAYRGSVLKIEHLSCGADQLDVEMIPQHPHNILSSAPPNPALVPSSVALLRSILQSTKYKTTDPPPAQTTMSLTVNMKTSKLEFEFSQPLLIGVPITCKYYMDRTSLNIRLKARETCSLTSNHELSQTVLKYLYTSNKVAVLQTEEAEDTMILSADSLTVGTLQILETSDANFFELMIKLKKVEVDHTLTHHGNEDESRLCDNRGFWDANALEAWRTRNPIGYRFQDRMKDLKKSRGYKEVKNARLKLRQEAREFYSLKAQIYPARGKDLKRRSSEIHDRHTTYDHDSENKQRGGQSKVELRKHLSEISNVSSVSQSSKSSGVGTWSSSGAIDGEQDYIALIINNKAANAMECLNELRSKVDLNQSEDLANHINMSKKILVEKDDGDAVVLAGFAEACVNVILQHLDSTGIPKTNLEEFASDNLLVSVAEVSSLYTSQIIYRLNEHKVQTLLRGEIYWLLANQETAQKFEESMLDHLRQISFHDSPGAMATFLKDVLLPCYINKQDNLLCLLYDELDQDRPEELNQIFSPEACSAAPSSNQSSMVSSVSSATMYLQDNRDVAPAHKRIPMARHKSFDAKNLSRQINVSKKGAAGIGKSSKAAATDIDNKKSAAIPSKKVGVKEKVRQAVANKRESARKGLIAAYKSPKKGVHPARRNLCFGKSPQKKTTTPVKRSAANKRTPTKLTPGKVHRIIVPSTPLNKTARRKSDGNRNVFETPDKDLASKSFLDNQRNKFYTDNSSRNDSKYEDCMNASLLSSTVSNPLFVSREVSERQNRNVNIFSNIMDRKRKRDSTDADWEADATAKIPKLTESGDGATSRTRARLISFSNDPQEESIISPRKEATTPRKGVIMIEESPCKKVSFNAKHMSATPKREGRVAKSILKTPIKTPDKDEGVFCQPTITPVRSARPLSYTPKKSPGVRRDISSPGGKTIRMLRISNERPAPVSRVATMKNVDSDAKNIDTPEKIDDYDEPTSPIITSSSKKRKLLKDSVPSPAKLSRIRKIEAELNDSEGDSDSDLNDPLCAPLPNNKYIPPTKKTSPRRVSNSKNENNEMLVPDSSVMRITNDVKEDIANDKIEMDSGHDNGTIDDMSSIPMPSFKDNPEERTKSKRKNGERSMLDDRLTHYFSPTSNKRTTKARQDIQDNKAITEALLKKSPKKKVGRSINFTSTPSQQQTVSDDKQDDIVTQYPDKNEVENKISEADTEQEDLTSHLTPAEVYKKTIKNQNLALHKSQTKYKSSPISNSIQQNLKSKLNNSAKRLSLSKPIETPNSEFSFNSSLEQEQDVSLPDQSSDFYTCATCKQKFPDKKEYISHHKECLLSSKLGVLFDKVKEKVPEPEEEEVEQKEKTKKDKKTDVHKKSNKAKKKNVKNKDNNECSDEEFVLETSNDIGKSATSRSKKGSKNNKKKDETDSKDKKKVIKQKTKAKISKRKNDNSEDESEHFVEESNMASTLSRRSVRLRAPVSYEEPGDLMISPKKKAISTQNEYLSPGNEDAQPEKKFLLTTDNKINNRLKLNKRMQKMSPSAKKCLTEKPVVKLKTINTSQEEILDLETTATSIEDESSPSPDNMGKFFSIGKRVETPDGKFLIQLNRVRKPSNLDKDSADSRSPVLKEPKTSQNKKMKSSKTSTPNMYARISRSATKDIGVSPSKLQSIMMGSPKRLCYPDITGSPNKENSDHQPSTPKIKLKRNKTLHENNDEWRISPVKKAVNASDDDVCTKSPNRDMTGSPWRTSAPPPGKSNFSPLSSRSIHILTKSPLVHPHSSTDLTKEQKLRRKKKTDVHKKLY